MTERRCHRTQKRADGSTVETLRCCRTADHDDACCWHFGRFVTAKPGTLITAYGQLVESGRQTP